MGCASFDVQVSKETNHGDWVTREFILSLDGITRTMTFHSLTAWTNSVTDNAKLITKYQRFIKGCNTPGLSPVAVVGGGGCEQAAVFIALDRVVQKISTNEEVDVFGTVSNLRQSRPCMIDSLEDYILLHHCVWEASFAKTTGKNKQPAQAPTGDGDLEETVF